MDVFQYIVVYNNFICLAERKQNTTDHHLTRPAMFNSSSPTVDSPHERQSGFRNRANFCSWIPESCAFESRIQFKESRIPANDWNLESEFHWQGIRNPVPGINNLQRGVQNPIGSSKEAARPSDISSVAQGTNLRSRLNSQLVKYN